jgi:hypothetical protein
VHRERFLMQDKLSQRRGYQPLRPRGSSKRIMEAFGSRHREQAMKVLKVFFAVAAMLVGLAAAAPVAAHGYHYHGPRYGYGPSVRFYYGVPYWGGGFYYGAPYGYYGVPYGYWPYAPPAVVTPPAPPVYIERNPDAAPAPSNPSAPAGEWWYLCANPRGAYPYVRECPGGWERVPAIPPGQAR